MANEPNDDKSGVTEPLASSSGVTVSAEKETPNSSAETIKTEEEIPYNERLNDPKWEDYLERQIEKGIERRLASQQTQTKPSEEEELKDLMDDFNIDAKTAKQLSSAIEKRVQKSISPLLGEINKKVTNQSWEIRVDSLAKKYPDSIKLQSEMLRVINSMDDHEKNFVLNSANGLEHLYEKTKRKFGNVSSNGQLNTSTVSSSSRSVPASVKLEETSELNKKSLEALQKGDRVEYERINRVLLKR